ncbi:LacI family transcriptional regulator [Alicyclobacillus cellulosilyticus]|uniref:LacI family transcriptional regulator n=1 Tax=Alicyclobacillus cellulosilyticus TaxID=1003997 RepID=A0A917NK31_9BACL|nr:LacI family DNA-binding transcriptional regulator [Alicyclobacillus cellulosilyticus]GGJ03680.1 LacI family transcriptional regulator [Alicyclobacillus cellulosilyticus]
MPSRLDVARLAGVSPSTVSRVLNNSGYVSEDVRKRVMQAIEELNYIPNRVAQSLRKQRSRQIACIAPSIGNLFYHEILAGIQETAEARDYTFSLYSSSSDKRTYLRVIHEGFYDGVILLSPFDVERVMKLEDIAAHIPLCLYCDRKRSPGIPHVYVDLRQAMRRTVAHLADMGHRNILFLGYEFISPDENPRYQGYVDALTEKGWPVQPELCRFIPDFQDTASVGYQVVKESLALGLRFTAVAASNDLLAIGAIRALLESGRRVPEDVSVTGVDDIEIAHLIKPSLTTVRIPKREIGNTLMHMLLEQIDRELSAGRMVEFPTELIIRESVRAVASSPAGGSADSS